jgi:hypothetical protein
MLGKFPTSPDKAEILKKISEIKSIVDADSMSSSILQTKLRNYLV